MEAHFSEDHLWGVATSAYQTEGGNSGSDWWEWERAPGSPCVDIAGRACDHFTRFEEDLELIAALGFNTYRFSIEWSRVQPEAGTWSEPAIAHYGSVLSTCHRLGLRPVVTFHHFTTPLWVTREGGWLDGPAPEAFAAFCGEVTRRLGHSFDVAITINEPNMPPLLGYLDGIHPPGQRSLPAYELATDSYLKGHALARNAIKEQAPDVKVGLALAMTEWTVVDGGEDRLREIRRLREDVFLEVARTDDFIGVNAYTRHEVGPEGIRRPAAGAETTALGWEYRPQALAACVRRARGACPGLPIFVTENGIGTDDDERRIDFVRTALLELHRTGIPTIGYLYWSALDNFEWSHGFGPRFGLIGVSRESFERSIKPSGRWLGGVAKTGVVPPD